MIKFFRHIRKSLLEENKMGKYFKYAIGEIILVVIGILIALQINNWNEGRKAKNNEAVLVKQLLVDAKKDSIFLKIDCLSSRIRYNFMMIFLISVITAQWLVNLLVKFPFRINHLLG